MGARHMVSMMEQSTGWERGKWSAGWATQHDGSEAHGQQDGAVRDGQSEMGIASKMDNIIPQYNLNIITPDNLSR
jgi:hypothetical protein